MNIRNARRNFAIFKLKMSALRRLDGSVTSSRKMGKVIHNFSVVMSTCSLTSSARFMRRDLCPPLEIMLENILPVLIKTLTWGFTHYIPETKASSQGKTSRAVLLHRQFYRCAAGCYKLFNRVILKRSINTLGKKSHASKQDLGGDSTRSTSYNDYETHRSTSRLHSAAMPNVHCPEENIRSAILQRSSKPWF
ncbi:unnamed protein product [Heligmosomoides polygyrus]|uniref:Pentatricopeptide repeat-containing protein n=1 Tax=Heligmosomoides polygyrus TaxID=6339 RepID=A0A183FFH5_HELPZ|nr:unnamed protein product [Heligmosomoides polygyrus]